jgi:hypothetical protein
LIFVRFEVKGLDTFHEIRDHRRWIKSLEVDH